MQVPFIKFLEVLVVAKKAPMEIQQRLQELGLDFPPEGMAVIREKLSSFIPDYFADPTATVDFDWLREWGIDKMYTYEMGIEGAITTIGIEGAFQILNDPLMYRLITSLALAKITDEDIELLVNGKYNEDYAGEDIVEFLHYFFDVAKWTLSQKLEYVDQVKDPNYKRFYKLALKGDKDYLVWKLGAAPDKSFDAMLRDMMHDAYFNFKERAKHDPDLAQKWGTLAIKLTDRIEKIQRDAGDKQDLFDAITFKLQVTKTKDNAPELRLRHISDLDDD